ncbi:MAG: carbamoyltransferase, partial [Candidatus Omnitrophica bacterium]|nr:carbamoyltransferase [Candidatus Omnitrophota bacterium]
MWILGISTGFAHDPSATLLQDGRVVMAVEEERLDRVKYGKGFPHRAIARCLEHAGIAWSDVSAVGLNFQPWKMYATDLALNLGELVRPGALKYAAFNACWAAYPFLSTLREVEKIKRVTSGTARIRFIDHHLCHAASSFLVSPFDEAAILTMDNRGERVSSTWGVGRGATIQRLGEVRFPHSLGLLYLSVTLYLGFRFGDEYQVMGLAAYGEPAFSDVFADLIRTDDAGGFTLNRSYFTYLGAEGFFSDKWRRAFGPRRMPGEPITKRHQDIACSLQRRLEEVVLHMAQRLHAATGARNLCLAGGVAFNSVMNGVLLKRSPFERVFVQPAAGDAGTSLGAALVMHDRQGGRPRTWRMTHALLGPAFSEEQIEEALTASKLSYERCPDIATRVAELLAQGRIVGWVQGPMEWGPRALGARSILADPRQPHMKDLLNACVKHRESFRPFAPAVVEERAAEYFDCPHPSPFMLFVHSVRVEKRHEIPAVTH